MFNLHDHLQDLRKSGDGVGCGLTLVSGPGSAARSCEALGKSLSCPQFQFLIHQTGTILTVPLGGIVRNEGEMGTGLSVQCLAR